MKALRGIALIGVLLLTGCASKLSDADYYDLVRERDGLSQLDDATLKDLGENICGVFRDTPDPYVTSLSVLTDGGYSAGDSGALIAYSVQQFCDDMLELVPTV